MSGHLPRVLEPEVMETPATAAAYDAMDFRAVNTAFCEDLLAELPDPHQPLTLLDVGTGTARIPQQLSQRYPQWQITATDLSAAMLAIAHSHVQTLTLPNITLCQCDAKALPFADGSFAVVISNSLIHHLADPRPALVEMLRVLQPGGLLFLRDLARPATLAHLHTLVQTYAQDANEEQRGLFADSLHAALTVDEIQTMITTLPQPPRKLRVQATSDRHWTVVARS
ncbi:methyltransferase domain-containing protein [Thermosynechococcaceae cyanobacterium Okahandja]